MRKIVKCPDVPSWTFFCDPDHFGFSFDSETKFLTIADQNNQELFVIDISCHQLYPRLDILVETTALTFLARPINSPITIGRNCSIVLKLESEMQISWN